MSSLNELIKYFFSISFITGAIVYIVKTIFKQSMSKDLERYKLELTHQINVEIEKSKKELEQNNKKDEIIFVKLYEERATILKELYSKTWDVQEALSVFIEGNNKDIEINNNFINQTKKIISEFKSYYQRNRIFLTEELDAKLDVLYEYLKMFIDEIDSGRRIFTESEKNTNESLVADFISIFPKLRDELLEEFVKILNAKQSQYYSS